MTCGFSKEQLALFTEGDLAGAARERTARHLLSCPECNGFLDELRESQALLKSLRAETVTLADCSRMRRRVMATIDAQQQRGSWALRLERALLLGVLRRPYALATVAFLCVVSASVVAQMRQAVFDVPRAEALFLDRDTLTRPDGYRDWVVVGEAAVSAEHCQAGTGTVATRTVYINPPAYREYAKTGVLPEGTLMIRASTDPRRPSQGEKPALLVSVKDSGRFAGGWGFFDFTAADGAVLSSAEAAPEVNACRTCHQRDAATDHVFTRFSPVLQTAHGSA